MSKALLEIEVDGECYLPAAAVGQSEHELSFRLGWLFRDAPSDEIRSIERNGRRFFSARWLRTEFPECRLSIDRAVRKCLAAEVEAR